ncbi:MAG: tetratricopeptide repeat-containing sulfotransferase family protein [Neptuniibacter sp.]
MSHNDLKKIVLDMQGGSLAAAEEAVETMSVTNKEQRDELYELLLTVQAMLEKRSLLGGEDLLVKGYRKVLTWNPSDYESAINISVLLMKWGDLSSAKECLEPLAAGYSEDFNWNYNAGVLHFKLGQFKSSLECFKKCQKQQPENPNVVNFMAVLFSSIGEDNLAMEHYRKTIQLDPYYKTAYLNLSRILRKYKLKDEAIKMIEMAVKVDPAYVEAYHALATIFHSDGKLSECKEMCEIALTVDPMHVPTKQLLSKVLNIKGDIDKSKELIVGIEKHRMTDPGVYLSKLEQEKKPLSVQEKSTLLDLIDNGMLSDFKMCIANLALSRSSEFEKDYEKEIEYMRRAKKYKRKVHSYEPGTIKGFADLLIDTFDAELVSSLSALEPVETALKPIFIVGPPRSGSTLTEQIISSIPGVAPIGESGFFGTAVRQNDLVVHLNQNDTHLLNHEFFSKVSGFYSKLVKESFPSAGSVITDKSLFNFFYTPILKACFPNAKIINCRRHPVDNSIGIYKQNFNDNYLNFADDIDSIVEFYEAYERLMQHWEEVMPGSVYPSSYEGLVANFESEARKIIDYCELEWDDQCLKFYENKREVKTASVLQVRQPIYKTAVAKWKRYEPFVPDLIDKLKKAGVSF